MSDYKGDFPEDATVFLEFSTFTSDDPAVSSTITELTDADIKVHKDGAATPITTDGASVVINLNSGTGTHMITIDTSVDVAYSTGSEYAVRIEGVTIDGGADIDAWVGSFSIERTGGALALTKALIATVGAAGVGLTEAGGDGDHLTAINLPNQTMDIVGDITGNLSGSVGSVSAGVTLAADAITAAKIADNAFANEHFANGALTSVEITSVGGADVTLIEGADATDVLLAAVDASHDSTSIPELSQGVPSATPTINEALMLNHMKLRNKLDVDTTSGAQLELHNSAGTRIAKKEITDDGTDYSEAKMTSGA